MDDFAEMNEVYDEFFKGMQCPARTTVEVAKLPMDALVEIEAIAILEGIKMEMQKFVDMYSVERRNTRCLKWDALRSGSRS